jgi:hypothetical protein
VWVKEPEKEITFDEKIRIKRQMEQAEFGKTIKRTKCPFPAGRTKKPSQPISGQVERTSQHVQTTKKVCRFPASRPKK